jgi:hypothetical protein
LGWFRVPILVLAIVLALVAVAGAGAAIEQRWLSLARSPQLWSDPGWERMMKQNWGPKKSRTRSRRWLTQLFNSFAFPALRKPYHFRERHSVLKRILQKE